MEVASIQPVHVLQNLAEVTFRVRSFEQWGEEIFYFDGVL